MTGSKREAALPYGGYVSGIYLCVYTHLCGKYIYKFSKYKMDDVYTHRHIHLVMLFFVASS